MFKKWLINEGRFDWQTTIISRAIIKTVKKTIPKMYSDRGEILYHGDPKYLTGITKITPKLIIDLDLKDLNILVLLIPSERLSCSGSYMPERKLLRINLYFQYGSKMYLAMMQKMIELLKGTIRHELEHTIQDFSKDSPDINWKDAKTVKKYFLDEREISAHVTQIYKTAKLTRTSFMEKFNNYIGNITKKLEHEGINPSEVIPEIEKSWIEYARKRFKIK